MAYFADAEPNQRLRAVPGAGTHVPVWILGSSLYGAQLAAHLGLPYAFASHFAPQALDDAAEVYRQTFRPSEELDKPHFMLAINVFAADTDAEGRRLQSSMQQAFARLRSGQPGPLPRPVDDIDEVLEPGARAMVDEALRVSVVGGPDRVRVGLERLVDRYRPDEVILTGQIHDHASRVRSFTLAAEAMQAIGSRPLAAAAE
jgi:luciferase family oxidoreductase group 1